MAGRIQIPKDGTDLEKFIEITRASHKKQAIWFLNGAWSKVQDEAQSVYDWVKIFVDLDPKKEEGHELDEFNGHRFLEKIHETISVRDLRDKLREIGYVPKPMMYPILVNLMMHFGTDWHEIVNADEAQGGMSQALIDAQNALAAVQKIINEIEAKKSRLEQESEGTGVKAMRAKNELAQLLSEDNLPLNRALLTAQAAVRKAQREAGEGGAGGCGPGEAWWMNAELEEMQRYKPQRKR